MKREDRRYKYAVHTSPAQHCVRDCDKVCDIEFIANPSRRSPLYAGPSYSVPAALTRLTDKLSSSRRLCSKGPYFGKAPRATIGTLGECTRERLQRTRLSIVSAGLFWR
jgi:hypothetical protein